MAETEVAEDLGYTREQLLEMTRRSLVDTVLASMAQVRLIQKENALLEVTINRLDTAMIRALRFIETEERQVAPGDPARLLGEIRELLTRGRQ